MDARLVGLLCASDQEAIAYCQMELADMGYYVTSDGTNFVFGVPNTDLIAPVLLLAHIDTCRDTDNVLPAIYMDTVYNENGKECGCLGADDRAGVHICLEIASRMPNKPYVLFTTGEEVGHVGMAAFLNADHPERATHEESFYTGKKLVEPYLDDIYAVLQYDRHGYNSVVAYGQSRLEYQLIAKAEVLGYRFEQGTTSDSRNFTEHTNIAHLNLSAGFVHQHSPDELLLIPAIDFAIRNGVHLCQMIDRPYRVAKVPERHWSGRYKYPPHISDLDNTTPDNDDKKKPWNQRPIDVIRPTCDICDKHRPVTYMPEMQANVCKKCLKRIYKKHEFDYAAISVDVHRKELEVDRMLSRKGNLPFTPTCPMAHDHEEVYPLENGVCFCDDCGTWFLNTTLGVYWWDEPHAKEAYFRFHADQVTIYPVRVADDACPLDNCMICGELTHDESLSYYDNKETGEYELIVCDKCNLVDPAPRNRRK